MKKTLKGQMPEEAREYFRECGRVGGASVRGKKKVRPGNEKHLARYWQRVKAGEIPDPRKPENKKPKQRELPLKE